MHYFLQRKQLAKSILIIAAPAILEMALNTLLMIADTLMVSQMIGQSALSGVGMVNSIFFVLIFVFSSFNTGAVALVSRSYGEKDMNKAMLYSGNNLTLNLMIGLVVTYGAVMLKNYFFIPYDVTEEVLSNAHSYYNIIIPGLIFQFISFALASSSRGVGDTKTPMYITAFANIFNIIFNYVLISGFWFFPEMGIEGAALSTTISRIIASFIYLYMFVLGNHKIRLTLHAMKIKGSHLGQLWKISWPGAIEQFLMQTSFLIVGIFVTLLDTSSEALFRILISIESTSFMPAVGISIATATLVGKSLGEKDIEKASDTGNLATIMGIVWGVCAALLFLIFPKFLLSLFTKETAILSSGVAVFKVMAFNQLFLTASIVMSGALRGAGDTSAVMWLTLFRLWLIFTPVSYLLIQYTSLEVASIWYAEVLSLSVNLLFLVIRFRSRRWAEGILPTSP